MDGTFPYVTGADGRMWLLVLCILAPIVDHAMGSALEAKRAVMEQPEMFAESDAYERFMGRWSRQLAPLLVKFASVGERDSVLDVGSGTGSLAFAVAEALSTTRVTGVDQSSGFVHYAEARKQSDRVRFVVGDAQKLQLPDASFDRTLSLLVMNFIPDSAKALREMIRVTRPGGIVAARLATRRRTGPRFERREHAANGIATM